MLDFIIPVFFSSKIELNFIHTALILTKEITNPMNTNLQEFSYQYQVRLYFNQNNVSFINLK